MAIEIVNFPMKHGDFPVRYGTSPGKLCMLRSMCKKLDGHLADEEITFKGTRFHMEKHPFLTGTLW